MTFLALHRGASTSLAVDRLWLGPEELTRAEDVRALLRRLEALAAAREQELAAARESARVEGRAEGRAQAIEAAAPRLAAAWEQAARRAEADSHALRAAVVELALQLVQRLLAGMDRAQLAAALAARAAEVLPPGEPATVRVAPAVAGAVRARLAGTPALAVSADAALGEDDCVFETPAGRVVAGLAVQLARLRAELGSEVR
jgi:flagellar biosynthesis/type III secretory pathway protein FliH